MDDGPAIQAPEAMGRARLFALGQRLRAEGRADDAAVVFEHLLTFEGSQEVVLRALARTRAAQGRTLEALELLVAARGRVADPGALLDDIREQTGPAAAKFNALIGAGQVEEAERYAAALAALAPQSEPLLAAALSCNQVLGRPAEAARYAQALLAVNPENAAARAAVAGAGEAADPAGLEIAQRMAQALSPAGDLHPLVRLRDLHDVISLILCRPLTAQAAAEVEALLAAARTLAVELPAGSEFEGWEKHYRVLLEALDVDAVRAATPEAAADPKLKFVAAGGRPLDWAGVRDLADRLGADCVFFAAADEAYVDLYARWYALSVLKHSDTPSLVVIHVIGGARRLKAIARKVGVADERLVFAGDDFDAAAVATRCYDAPPKGLIDKPVAHFQSVRFLRLGDLLRRLERPVFVSDIDLLLQRGVRDLLAKTAAADVVLNENEISTNAGSRLTANLVLARPTAGGLALADFLQAYLRRMLAGEEVTRWIDQVALLLGRHHLQAHGFGGGLAYFDTASDINNVMYPSYREHPFRFLSLYHGFDTSSLEDPRVLGEAAAAR